MSGSDGRAPLTQLLATILEINKNVVIENQKLREELKAREDERRARDEEHSKVMSDILKELQQVKTQNLLLSTREEERRARDEEHKKIMQDILKELQQDKTRNRLLSTEQEQLGAVHEDHEEHIVMQDILKELKTHSRLSDTTREQLGQKKQRIQVPAECRRTLRKVYNSLIKKKDSKAFFLHERVDSPNNRQILGEVKEKIYAYVGGKEKCEWSDAQIEEAFKRYFMTAFESKQRKDRGKDDEHRTKCRRLGRRREKLNRRVQALSVIDWETQMKAEMAEALKEDFISSEESSEESDSGELVYKVKRLAWESKELSQRKKKLDELYHESQQKKKTHSQERRVKRVRNALWSVRGQPDNCPAWACNQQQDAAV